MSRDEPSVDASNSELEESKQGEAGAEEQTETIEMQQESQEPEEPEGEDKSIKIVRSPGMPSAAERAEHNITHWPYRNWCEHCVKGRALGQAHRSMKGEFAESDVARVLMDYGYLHEEETVVEDDHGEKKEAKISLTTMVMVETMNASVWAYALDAKGTSTLDWLARQVVEDLETVGLNKEKIITKTDQEVSMTQLQREIARQRGDAATGTENSRVGDSNSNGRIERAIREVKGLVRTLRSAIEENTKGKITLADTVVPWLVRHAAYLITRCRVGQDGKTAMQRLKGRKVSTPLAEFGETILFKLPKVRTMPGDFENKFETGIWLGCTVRSGEHIVGTPRGVYKVSSIMRKAEDRRWSLEMIKDVNGSPMEPIPGSGQSKIRAFARQKENTDEKDAKFAPPPERTEPEVRPTYIYKKDVEEHGPTEGCPGCRAAMNPTSSFRAKHSVECRKRFEEIMKQSEDGKRRVEKAEERMNKAVAKKFEDLMQEDAGGASGSGLSNQDRTAGMKRTRDGETDAQSAGGEPEGESKTKPKGEYVHTPKGESDGEPKGESMRVDPEPLQEAPEHRGDLRVPLDPRNPAQKRGRSPSGDQTESAKFQAYEKADNKRKNEEDKKQSAKWQAVEVPDDDPNKPADAVEVRHHEKIGPKTKQEDITPGEMRWKDVGSGTMARTFKDAKRLQVSTRGGPPESEVYRRTVWNVASGRIIDDCIVDDTADEELYRELPFEMDIRVELIMKDALDMYKRRGADVVEVFSPPRIAQEAAMKAYSGTRLRPGWSLDLTRNDPKTGMPWDLSDKSVQNRVRKLVRDSAPLFLIGSPPCTAFSSMQNASRSKRDPATVEKELEEAKQHMRFCIELYVMQLDGGRCFIHEHPAGATSWNLPETIQLLMHEEVGVATFDMCQFGMTAKKDGVERPVQKCTRVASNSKEVLKRLRIKCPNKGGPGQPHEHIQLEGTLTKEAQVYPKLFCQTVCEGVAAEKRIRALGLETWSLDEISVAVKEALTDERYGDDPSKDLHEGEEEIEKLTMKAQDDLTGEELDPEEVKKARKEEITYFRNMNVYKKVPLEECLRETGKKPIGIRWVDINKGDRKNINYRSRLVAKEFKDGDKPEWYAATPPGECLKLLLNKMAAKKGQVKLVYADVSRAYFYAKASRPVYVELPEEDKDDNDGAVCGRLNVSMYGTRDAARNWAEEYAQTLRSAGFKRGVTNPCLFWNPTTDVSIMVHGDDFVAVGEDDKVEQATKALKETYKLKVEKLGNGDGEVKEVKILNKIVRLVDEGLEMEADPRHAELVVRALKLEDAKAAATPGVKQSHQRSKNSESKEKGTQAEDAKGEIEDDEVMSPKEATEYRAVVARLNYLAPDRPDMQYSIKEAARAMANPRKKHWDALTRIGRYIRGKPRLIIKFGWQTTGSMVSTYSDSDWAGCQVTGRSTSGGVVTVGKHVIKAYSRQQKTIALSSAEAELHAMVAASSETLGLIALARDLGMTMTGDVHIDSSAALGVSQRMGQGKLRHVKIQALWVQEIQCNRRLRYHKVLGTRNPSDILTKHVGRELLTTHLATLGLEHRGGRADKAPELDNIEPYTELYSRLDSHRESRREPEDRRAREQKREPAARRVRISCVVQYRAIPSRIPTTGRTAVRERVRWPGAHR